MKIGRYFPFALLVGVVKGAILTAAIIGATAISASAQDLAQVVLAKHNALRALHCAPALRWDASLAATAQASANRCVFQHSKNGFGENLAMGTSGAYPPESQVQLWYDEFKNYDFAKPVFGPNTGHFTQVVWRSTTAVGCGLAKCQGQDLLVCNYSPPGNYDGQYQQNVPQLCNKQPATNPAVTMSPPSLPRPSYASNSSQATLKGDVNWQIRWDAAATADYQSKVTVTASANYNNQCWAACGPRLQACLNAPGVKTAGDIDPRTKACTKSSWNDCAAGCERTMITVSVSAPTPPFNASFGEASADRTKTFNASTKCEASGGADYRCNVTVAANYNNQCLATCGTLFQTCLNTPAAKNYSDLSPRSKTCRKSSWDVCAAACG